MNPYSKAYFDEVTKHLRRKYRISWVKVLREVGWDFLNRFYHTGNMAERTAEAVWVRIKEIEKLRKQIEKEKLVAEKK